MKAGESLESPSFKCKAYKCWNLPPREGNSVTYPVCHLAELPEKGLAQHQSLHITFCFYRKIENLAAPTELKEIKPSAYLPLRAEVGSKAHRLIKQREAGLGLGTAGTLIRQPKADDHPPSFSIYCSYYTPIH